MEIFFVYFKFWITFAKMLSIVPDYKITIRMKIGKPKSGYRWHPSYDIETVRVLVEKKIIKTIGMASVENIDIAFSARSTGNKIETKCLTID